MNRPESSQEDTSTDLATDPGTPQEILDRCFGVDARTRDRMARGEVPAKLLRSMDWVTGRPAFRWQSALGLIGIAAGPQILWWQNGSPTLLTWLSPIPATAAFAWWILRRRAYLRLAKKSLSGPMISTVVGLGTSTTRWTVDSQGERKAQTSLQVAGETFPTPKGGEGVAIDGPVRIQVLSLVSLDHPHSPPTRWLVAVELLDPT